MLQTATTAEPTLDQLETLVARCEAAVARVQATQLEALRALEARSVAALDGARSFVEWTAARLDVTANTAERLVRAARHGEEQPGLEDELAAGLISFDRAAATIELAAAGADAATLADSRGLDLGGVDRLTARHRRIGRAAERRRFADRYLTMQPSLAGDHWKLHGVLPGLEGELVARAVSERGDDLHRHVDPGIPPASRPQRAADALVSMAEDTLDPPDAWSDDPAGGGRAPLVSVFVDAALAAASGGEAGIELAAGPRIGPETIERILCTGRVEVTTTGARPLAVGHASRVVPPRLRRFVLHRDGGCAVDGCRSRYRLQAHHVVPVSKGGATDAENLVTLCWYHHHVVVHGRGYRIDPHSPPRRVRFLRPAPSRAPP